MSGVPTGTGCVLRDPSTSVLSPIASSWLPNLEQLNWIRVSPLHVAAGGLERVLSRKLGFGADERALDRATRTLVGLL